MEVISEHPPAEAGQIVANSLTGTKIGLNSPCYCHWAELPVPQKVGRREIQPRHRGSG